MFAYVRYIDDNCKDIIPTTYQKDFDYNTYDKSKTYWVRWENAFFKGQIVRLVSQA